MRSRTLRLAALAVGVVVLGGCSLKGTQSLPTPLSKDGGSDGYDVTVLLASAGGLVPHSEVKVDDVTVGQVRSIGFEDWHARVVVRVQKGTRLPADARAQIGQKSLLGAEYLGLSTPPGDTTTEVLRAGDVVPLSRTGSYPETEQVLAALSLVLNDSGLEQVATINTELNKALDGRTADTRALLTNLQGFFTALDAQKASIVATIDDLNDFSASLAKQDATIAEALDRIGPGLAALNANVPNLSTTLTALTGLDRNVSGFLDEIRPGLDDTLRQLQPALAALQSTGTNLPKIVNAVGTYPFPTDHTSRDFRGDYSNLFAAIDLRCATLAKNFFTGVVAAGDVFRTACSAAGSQSAPTNANPLTAPLDGTAAASAPAPSAPSPGSLLGGVGGLVGGSPTASPSPTRSSGSGLLGGLLGGNR